ncbi:hypothetical protein GCM10010400_77470 [Streptomyces aculeolatus]|uniref:helix-turn-helix domain-containing protein n=1 Tax=Streptomyces aculeolatus TaxID=270689 RepID=UPI001CED44A1|nr:helix-turn-helix transcriptional regulator [Streptomyces aculeolatus]
MHRPQPFFEVDGDAIRRKRMDLGLDTEVLADSAEISRRYLSHLENGTRRRMRPGKYAALRAALGADANELLLAPPSTDSPKE